MDSVEDKKKNLLKKPDNHISQARELLFKFGKSFRLRQLQEPAPENVYLEDDDEKMEILTFVANASFIQAERGKAEPVKTFLINRFVWAAIWVTPVETIREWKAAVEDNEPLPFNEMVLTLRGVLPQLVYFSKFSQAPKRDNYRCVSLGLHDPEVANIYAHASIYLAGCCSLVSGTLKRLWCNGPIREFMKEMRIRHIDALENMISISCDIHLRMNNFKITLEHLEEISDNNELCLRLRHLKDSSLGPEKGHKSNYYDTRAVPLNQDPKELLKELLTHDGDKLELDFRNIQTAQRIGDGYVFSIQTNDRIYQPLPIIRIMQVYYCMALMVRLAGAVEDDDDDNDDDDEDTPDTPSEGKLISPALLLLAGVLDDTSHLNDVNCQLQRPRTTFFYLRTCKDVSCEMFLVLAAARDDRGAY
ncbi:hypothetical protein LZ31DRAFT_564833 [Colletotrichum somersetense]|nr:hypothetical protein LZ31DRAFT_564833 [Colletotrichum somersetense]